MRRYSAATPCPGAPPHTAQYAVPNPYAINDTMSFWYEDTSNVEYTTELQAQIRNAKPRRRPRDARRQSSWNPAADIYDEVQQKQPDNQSIAPTCDDTIGPPRKSGRRTSILARPAQKIPIILPAQQEESKVMPARRRRVSAVLADRDAESTIDYTKHADEILGGSKGRRTSLLRKDPRRRTIYVPSEDTTIMTIHPGAPMRSTRREAREKSPDMGLELVTLSEEEVEDLKPALRPMSTKPRKSLAAPPKRAPLQHATKSVHNVTFALDIPGRGPGKENVPPGTVATKKGTTIVVETAGSMIDRAPRRVSQAALSKAKPKTAGPAEATNKPLHGGASTRKRRRPESTCDLSNVNTPPKIARASMAKSIAHMNHDRGVMRERSHAAGAGGSSPFRNEKSPPMALRRSVPAKAPLGLGVLRVSQNADKTRPRYPVLSDDLARPELYEDNWLDYQEVSLTQLVNGIFDTCTSAHLKAHILHEPAVFRKRFLDLYHEPANALLHKRLQASLLYGALSIPKNVVQNSVRLRQDVGMRKKFLDLWTETYDTDWLSPALEAVAGRELSLSQRLSNGSAASGDGGRQQRAERRAISKFVEAFFITHEDAVRVRMGTGSIASLARAAAPPVGGDDFGSQCWAWRRTVLRSLMLVQLLDRAKATGVISGCLFLRSSPHKSSASLLTALAGMLLPTLGEVTRPLAHFEYRLTAAQLPLQELAHRVDNLATGLRDGILLTRLVELLLYSPAAAASLPDATITLTLPSGEYLTSATANGADEATSFPLSCHLKVPAHARAQKLHNAQVALSALHGAGGIVGRAAAAEGVTAEDIVDGHREKTLGLLWVLVGESGLGQLIDWGEVRRETARFRAEWREWRKANKREKSGRDEDTCALNVPGAYADAQRDGDASDPDSETDVEQGGGRISDHAALLLAWARALTRARTHGELEVRNLTTSFAAPRALECIADAYLPFFLDAPRATSAAADGLSAKLLALGCTPSFVALFAPPPTAPASPTPAHPLPTRRTTLATLSFLAARLLPRARAHRAAAAIQRAFRARLARRHTARLVVLRRLAGHAAEVVRGRERVVRAATAVQRAWRAVMARRVRVLERWAVEVQSAWRGRGARERAGERARRRGVVLGGLGGVSAGTGKGRARAMGGW